MGQGQKGHRQILYFLSREGTQRWRKAKGESRQRIILGASHICRIPLPGTGAWTGTLAASILDMDFKKSVWAVMGGVALAGVIMAVVSFAVASGVTAVAG